MSEKGPLGNSLGRWTTEIVVALAALLFIMPVVLIFLTSMKPDGEIIRLDGLFPNDPAAGIKENFGHILGNPDIAHDAR